MGFRMIYLNNVIKDLDKTEDLKVLSGWSFKKSSKVGIRTFEQILGFKERLGYYIFDKNELFIMYDHEQKCNVSYRKFAHFKLDPKKYFGIYNNHNYINKDDFIVACLAINKKEILFVFKDEIFLFNLESFTYKNINKTITELGFKTNEDLSESIRKLIKYEQLLKNNNFTELTEPETLKKALLERLKLINFLNKLGV